MKMLFFVSLLCTMLPPVPSDTKSTNQRNADQLEIDKATAVLKDTLRELTALDESDKQIERSNQTQIDTTALLDRREDKIMHEEVPAMKERGYAWDKKRQQLIDGGCSEDPEWCHGRLLTGAILRSGR